MKVKVQTFSFSLAKKRQNSHPVSEAQDRESSMWPIEPENRPPPLSNFYDENKNANVYINYFNEHNQLMFLIRRPHFATAY
jgi:hypothetical protein